MQSDMRESDDGAFDRNGRARPYGADPAASAPPRVRRRVGLSARIGRAACIGGAALALALILVTLLLRNRLPPLSVADLEQAERRWQAARVEDYDMDVKVSGRQPSDYHVEVRGGKPVTLLRNGVVPRRGMWDVWTVPGIFVTLHEELELATEPAGPFGSPPGTQVVQRAEFDARYGYPKKYHRIVMGTPLETEWEVLRFRVLDAGKK